jgi:galactonate dehydratase
LTGRIAALDIRFARASERTVWTFVRVATEAGLEGWGEATLFGREAVLAERARELRARLLGRPARPEALAAPPDDLPGAAVSSAAEQALWDILAREARRSLADELGRRRERVPVYANINRRTRDRSPAGFAASARDALAAGHRALKLAPFDEVGREAESFDPAGPGLARIEAVRAAAPPDVPVMVDCHWRFADAMTERLVDACVERGVAWLECPVPETPDAIPLLKRLRARANAGGMLLAGLEELVGAERFRPYLEAGAYDVVMPDVKYVGGLSELLRTAELAERYGAAASPHNPSGPIAHAASLAAAAAAPALHSLELQFDESPLFGSLAVPGPPGVEAGEMSPLAGSGLGLRPVESLLSTSPNG